MNYILSSNCMLRKDEVEGKRQGSLKGFVLQKSELTAALCVSVYQIPWTKVVIESRGLKNSFSVPCSTLACTNGI